jgi:hypothetical protein
VDKPLYKKVFVTKVTIKEIIEGIKHFYKLRRNVKLKNIDFEKMTFQIRIGDCESAEIEFPIEIRRNIKIDRILNEK